jgi:16S rRNA G966 N2-methylase RsmD
VNLKDSKIQDFINRQLHSTAADLMLQASKYPQWDMKAIAQQLTGKQIAQKKLPAWFKNDDILYPARISMEQCSSEATAKYKSTVIHSGKGIDLTGGFGVDSYFLAKKSDSLIYCERNEDLATLVSHNFETLKQTNYEVFVGDGIQYLKKLDKLDWIFVDPARRKNSERVFKLEDCEPNVIDLKDLFFEKAKHILIKTAPLLDIRQTLSDLEGVKEVHVIAVNNDCKEVLYLLEKDFMDEAQIFCVNLKKGHKEEFRFNSSEERETIAPYSEPLEYIYEANAAIMKAGAFKSIASKYKLYKLHQHSHLYTSDHLVSDFPGRSFKVKELVNPDKKLLAKHISGKANLACRNFPQKVDVLKKKLKLKDGGDDYIFATTLSDGKPKLILCSKV